MKKTVALAVCVGFVALGFWVVERTGVPFLNDPALAASGLPEGTKASGAVPTAKKATFLELGSVGCIPCEQMVPVMDAVRQKHGDRVDVIFHDVRRNPSVARQWGIRLIPTQVFLDTQGKEFFRHEGFFALNDVLNVLRKMGVD